MSLADKLMRYGVDTLPHVRYMSKKAWSEKCIGGSSTKSLPPVELRNSDVPAVVRSFQLSAMKFFYGHARPCLYHVGWSPHATDMHAFMLLLLLGGIDSRRCAEARPADRLLLAGQSPAHTYLKQHWQPLQVLALSQSLFCLLLRPILTTAIAALENLQSEDLAL
jgi:hypothetical protein